MKIRIRAIPFKNVGRGETEKKKIGGGGGVSDFKMGGGGGVTLWIRGARFG